MSVILPIAEQPPVLSYQRPAFTLSLLLGNRPDALPWAAAAYFNMVWRDRIPDRLDEQGQAVTAQLDPLTACSDYLDEEGLFTRQTLFLCPETLGYGSVDILAMICSMLDRQQYVTGQYDEYYIPAKGAYQKRHMDHDYLLYGYDADERCFYSLGYTGTGLYQPFRLAYDDFLQSVQEYAFGPLKLYFRAPVADAPCAFDPAVWEERVRDYLASPTLPDGGVTGLRCFDKYIDHLGLQLTYDAPYLDSHHGRVIWEHMGLTHAALQAWLEARSLTEAPQFRSLVAAYGGLVPQAETLKNLIVKYHLRPERRIVMRMKTIAQELRNRERELLSAWLEQAERQGPLAQQLAHVERQLAQWQQRKQEILAQMAGLDAP